MWSSPFLLSASAIFGLLGFTFVLIAGFTDNWLEYQVSRKDLAAAITQNSELKVNLKENWNKDIIYYSRTYGLLHICFPENIPSDIGSFSKFGSPCIVNPDYFPELTNKNRYNAIQHQRLWFMRAEAACYFIGVVIIAICFLFAIIGCYKQSAKLTLATALFLFFAVLFLVVSMALWHYVNYIERQVLDVKPFYRTWEPVLKQITIINFGWSYIAAWVSIGFFFFAAIFLLFSYKAMKDDEERIYESKHAAYFQQYYDKSLVPVMNQPYGGSYPGYSMYPPPTPYTPYAGYGSNNYYGYMPY